MAQRVRNDAAIRTLAERVSDSSVDLKHETRSFLDEEVLEMIGFRNTAGRCMIDSLGNNLDLKRVVNIGNTDLKLVSEPFVHSLYSSSFTITREIWMVLAMIYGREGELEMFIVL